MIKQIENYILFLKNEHNFNVSIHTNEKGLLSVVNLLTPYNIHSNMYCMHIKTCDGKVWNHCCNQQKRVNKKAEEGVFFGSCFAGVGEYVFPVKYNETLLGFVSVSGYYGSEEKRHHFAKKHNLDQKELKALYEEHLSPDIPKYERLETLIAPLVAMLILASMKTKNLNTNHMADYIYSHLVSIIDSSYSENLTVESLAESCHCSISHISHLFKKKSGLTIFQYLTKVRLKHAKSLLKNSDLFISEISEKTGFSDPNYFSYVFSKAEGISPREYRKKSKPNINSLQ